MDANLGYAINILKNITLKLAIPLNAVLLNPVKTFYLNPGILFTGSMSITFSTSLAKNK